MTFFVETDGPDFRRERNRTGRPFIQDVYLECNPDEKIPVDAGTIPMPFSLHRMQGSTSLLGLDRCAMQFGQAGAGKTVQRSRRQRLFCALEGEICAT